MKIDLCRKYEQKLQVMQTYNDHNQPLCFECNNCGSFVDASIHQHENLPSQSFLQHFGANAN